METQIDYIKANRNIFKDTPFHLLMQKRITDILLICSAYDKFMLEQDGRIDEQLFQEYVSLNLRYPPRFTHVSTKEEAFSILEERKFDLIIIMFHIGGLPAVDLSRMIKERYPKLPIVILVQFSREIIERLEHENLGYIDYVFCWLGNANILLAVVKLIEDRLNADFDIKIVGVQAIILVEDSIRYYSSYLPTIYHALFEQAGRLMEEGLNEHQQTLRMRGRPKILLASNYEEAMGLYNSYKDNLLGIISDISYFRGGERDVTAGLRLCEEVRKTNLRLPILLQSSFSDHEKAAKECSATFLHKFSKNLLPELKQYIQTAYGFGDFHFRNPLTFEVIDIARDLKEFQEKIPIIPDASLRFHLDNRDFSKWLKARALHEPARVIRSGIPDEISNLSSVREFILSTITSYRIFAGRGTIALFDRESYDLYTSFGRIGKGSLGGKGRGLAFIDLLLKDSGLSHKYKDVIISIPRTIVLATDIFEEFMTVNNLYPLVHSDIPDDEILQHFLKARFPKRVREDLTKVLSFIEKPLAIRSSSLLEDSHFQPFAGIYSTYMIPNRSGDAWTRTEELCRAVKGVYASTFYKGSRAYMAATHNIIDEEKMAVIIQELVGNTHNDICFPTISGVARSVNYYPLEEEKTEDGIVSLALGLGKTVVEGGVCLRFSPSQPKKLLQLNSPAEALKTTQKKFYALSLKDEEFVPQVNEDNNLAYLKIEEAVNDSSFPLLVSTYDYDNDMLRDGPADRGKTILSFSGILKHDAFPLADIIKDLLLLATNSMDQPVEIEFAVNLDIPAGKPKVFSFLQVRPVVESFEAKRIDLDKVDWSDILIYSEKALGNGFYEDLSNIIYVKPSVFNPAHTKIMEASLEELNERLVSEKRHYILIVPGRLGSADPWLGIPVQWRQVSGARVIVESGLPNYRIEPSQGTHFFQNITSLRVGYFTINPFQKDGYYDTEYLDQYPAAYEDSFIRHVELSKSCLTYLDGRKRVGLILKPGRGEKYCSEQKDLNDEVV